MNPGPEPWSRAARGLLAAHMAVHFGLSAAVALAAWTTSRDLLAADAAFGVGALLDVDHFLFDYLIGYFEKVYPQRFDLSKYLQGEYWDRAHKRHLFFHGYEWLIVIWALAFWLGSLPFGLAVSVSYTAHLLFDQWSYRLPRWHYFLTYRWIHGFRFTGG